MAQPNKRPPSEPPPAGGQLARLQQMTQSDFELEFFGAVLARHPSYVEMLRAHAKNLAQRKRYAEGLLVDRRIIQLQNAYQEIRRQGRAQVWDGERMTGTPFTYRLPKEWALVP